MLTCGLATLPGKPPAFGRAYYQASAAKAGGVDDFEKFNRLKAPVPEDRHAVQADAEENDVKRCAESPSLSKARTKEREREPEKMKNRSPWARMTPEDPNE
ncbi:unnamed protein product [Gulo gulo]|uniref:ATP synthase-coupling factor 6, mitochondrial n=1 Tax=Gulo gulo TaxID=48420 RepID=A0A9X9LH31_GULGU|nr:unnamed protein product [Gulo gulo]